jgi:hypothetical protein
MRSVLVAAVAVVGFAGAAQSQQILAAGGLYGGPSQVRAVCYFYNSGSSSIALAGTNIIDANGTPQPLAVDQCGVAIAAGRTCGIAANATNNQPYSCRTFVSPGKGPLRGVLEMRDSQQQPLASVELR